MNGRIVDCASRCSLVLVLALGAVGAGAFAEDGRGVEEEGTIDVLGASDRLEASPARSLSIGSRISRSRGVQFQFQMKNKCRSCGFYVRLMDCAGNYSNEIYVGPGQKIREMAYAETERVGVYLRSSVCGTATSDCRPCLSPRLKKMVVAIKGNCAKYKVKWKY